MKISRNPIRWILAFALMPIMPILAFELANLGKDFGHYMVSLANPVLLAAPWFLVIVAGLVPALGIGAVVLMFTPSRSPVDRPRSDVCPK
ncbi:hypothetical protein [Pseudomonas sp. S1(2024)]|uniref:hypothetical protein n=1 Tax=Pseudomonas sp. S1(2024) TaxID=3390191 RepID=UPI00397BED1F